MVFQIFHTIPFFWVKVTGFSIMTQTVIVNTIRFIPSNIFSDCFKGRIYNKTLKLSGCADDEFTCSDGQCIKIINRCDQIINCRDETDEQDCRLLALKNGYNKVVPPFTLVISIFLYSID